MLRYSEMSILHVNSFQQFYVPLLTAGSEFRVVFLALTGVVFVLTFSIALLTQEERS